MVLCYLLITVASGPMLQESEGVWTHIQRSTIRDLDKALSGNYNALVRGGAARCVTEMSAHLCVRVHSLSHIVDGMTAIVWIYLYMYV